MTARSRAWVFLGLVALGLVAIVTRTHEHFLPAGIATQIGHNSEALLFTLLVAGSIHLRRRLPGHLSDPILLALAVLLVGSGWWLKSMQMWPSSVVTLNEPLIGAGLVAVYLCLPRSPVLGIATSAAVIALIIGLFDTDVVLDQAESLVPLALAPLALDVFDRRILSPEQPDRPRLRILWVVVLLVIAVASMFLARWARPDLDTPLHLGIDYSQRAAEAYWGWLLLHLYFSYWLPARFKRRGAGAHAGPVDNPAQPG